MNKKILIFNVGSETLKYAFYKGRFIEKKIFYTSFKKDEKNKIEKLIKNLIEKFDPDYIAHRIVHGGDIKKTCFIIHSVIREIKKYEKFAPLHNPHELKVIELCQKYAKKQVKQIAVFDTAFFANLPKKTTTYALPLHLLKKYNIKHYGFHGINHHYIAQKFPNKSIISCHLGAGCSIAAIKDNKALDISMGFTPLEGVMMVTRAGSIDPGIILLFVEKFGLKNTKKILNESSGLYGLTGSKDVKKIVKQKNQKKNKDALELFCYNIAKQICAYQAALKKIDIIAFSGGIGEANSWIRKKICSYLPFKFKKAVVKADEEEIIFNELRKLLKIKI